MMKRTTKMMKKSWNNTKKRTKGIEHFEWASNDGQQREAASTEWLRTMKMVVT